MSTRGALSSALRLPRHVTPRGAAWGAAGAVAVTVLAALGWALVHPAATPPASVVGHQAPDFTMRTLDGHSVRLTDLRGHAVVVNVWASWCAPCRQEEQPLRQAATDWQGRVQFLGVDFKDSQQAATAAQQQARYPYPVGPVTGGMPAAYAVTAPPETFFIDARGTVVAAFEGPIDRPTIDRYLQLAGVRS